MLLHRHAFAHRSDHVEINFARDDTGSGSAMVVIIDSTGIGHNDTPRIHNETVPVRFSLVIVSAKLRSGNHVALVFNGSGYH